MTKHKFFHLSHNKRIYEFYPRVPKNLFEDEFGNKIEDSITPRICVSKHITGCLRAIFSNYCKIAEGETFFVHQFDSNIKIKIPTVQEVPDVKLTNEVWILEKVKSIIIGEIKVGKNFKWKWISR